MYPKTSAPVMRKNVLQFPLKNCEGKSARMTPGAGVPLRYADVTIRHQGVVMVGLEFAAP